MHITLMTSFALPGLTLPLAPSEVLLYGIAVAAALVYFPYLFVAIGRVSIGLDLNAPRAMFDRLPDYAKRATWAHQNSFEVFMLFAAAALCVYVSRGGSDATNTLIVTFLAARLGFSLFYLLNIPWLRSPMWVISMICVGGLFNASLH
jgi:uncharacterized MAPEG superfamily protein